MLLSVDEEEVAVPAKKLVGFRVPVADRFRRYPYFLERSG
jgi:hypothetical protein